MNIALPLIALCVVLNTAAQLLLKATMNHLEMPIFAMHTIIPLMWHLMTSSFFLLGIGCYMTSLCLWLVVLSHIDVSIAFPLTSFAFILNAIGAYYLLDEPLSLARITGIIVIMLGVYLVTRSA